MNTYVTCSLLFAVIAAPALAQQKPAFCRNLDCPLYESENNGDYEVRRMAVDNFWVTTTSVFPTSNINFWQSSSMFRKLYDYIQGSNQGGTRYAMTVPVLTKASRRADGQFEITMMFYISTPEQPPAANDQAVSIYRMPAGESFYVRQFRKYWWASTWDWEYNMNALKQSLGNPALYNENEFFVAGYESPWHFGIRHYEVWMSTLA